MANKAFNDAHKAVGREAKKGLAGANAGIRSGYNEAINAGWGGFFGTKHLGEARDRIKSGWKAGAAGWGEGGEGAFTNARKAAWGGIDGLGGNVWDFFSGAGMKTGVGRGAAVVGRSGMVAGAMAAVDFLNPFGDFGSIRD